MTVERSTLDQTAATGRGAAWKRYTETLRYAL